MSVLKWLGSEIFVCGTCAAAAAQFTSVVKRSVYHSNMPCGWSFSTVFFPCHSKWMSTYYAVLKALSCFFSWMPRHYCKYVSCTTRKYYWYYKHLKHVSINISLNPEYQDGADLLGANHASSVVRMVQTAFITLLNRCHRHVTNMP